jgi:DNA-binding transcriptional MocR family regulator
MFDSHMKQLVNLYANRMSSLKDTLLEYKHPRIKHNIPESGYFGCFYVDTPLSYDKIITSLYHKNIKILDTRECFLKEYKCANYLGITISEVNEKQIAKNIPIIINSIENHLD